MKRLFFTLMACFLAAVPLNFAQPFGPPLYIGDTNTLECRYYFAGDPKHFNPRPENFSENIGYTTDFKSQEQACEFFRCVFTNGTVKVNQNNEIFEQDLCICGENRLWGNFTGCVSDRREEAGFFSRFLDWIKNLFP